MKVVGLSVCMIFIFFSAGIKAQTVIPQQPPDSVNLVVEDSNLVIRNDSVEIITEVNNVDIAQEDSLGEIVDSIITATSSDSFMAPSYMFKPSPRKAVIYSAIFPGLGQIYNRNYWKLPIVYGGFVGFTYAITWNNGYYRDYLEGYKDIMDDNPETISWHDMLPYGMDYDSVDKQWFAGVLQQRKDYYRYYRDLSIIGTVAWYLLAIVDAYVDAQLFDFDMSPDLSMRIEPAIMREDQPNYIGNSYGLQWSFSF